MPHVRPEPGPGPCNAAQGLPAALGYVLVDSLPADRSITVTVSEPTGVSWTKTLVVGPPQM